MIAASLGSTAAGADPYGRIAEADVGMKVRARAALRVPRESGVRRK